MSSVVTCNLPCKTAQGLTAENEVLTRTWTCAPNYPLRNELRHARLLRTGGSNQIRGISENVIGNDDLANDFLEPKNLRTIQNRRHLHFLVGGRRLHDLNLFSSTRIIDVDAEHEPVELGLGERIGSFLFERILRGEDEERSGNR